MSTTDHSAADHSATGRPGAGRSAADRSAAVRAYRPALRQGVLISPPLLRGPRTVHLIKHPVSGAAFEVGPKEHFVISRLDGTRNFDDLVSEYGPGSAAGSPRSSGPGCSACSAPADCSPAPRIPRRPSRPRPAPAPSGRAAGEPSPTRTRPPDVSTACCVRCCAPGFSCRWWPPSW
jgi:hypothetical protein